MRPRADCPAAAAAPLPPSHLPQRRACSAVRASAAVADGARPPAGQAHRRPARPPARSALRRSRAQATAPLAEAGATSSQARPWMTLNTSTRISFTQTVVSTSRRRPGMKRPLLLALLVCLAAFAPSAAGRVGTAQDTIAGSYIVVFNAGAV